MDGITPVMNVDGRNGYGYGDGMGSGAWIFGLIVLAALFNGGFGGFGGGRGIDGRCATVEDINNSANFTRLESQVQSNGSAIQSTASNIYNGICNLGYEMAQQFGNTNTKNAECCCTINRNIDAVRYEGALNTASINANTTAQVQKVLDTLCADKISALQGKVSQLELQSALCGVVRYPTSATFNAGYPFGYGYGFGGFNGCGCNGGNI